MGVKGWTYFLRRQGYLPHDDDSSRQRCCSLSMWRHHSSANHHDFASRLSVIPRGSELHVDGNGLAFLLHRVAYTRHFVSVLRGKDKANRNPHNGGSINNRTPCSIKKKLSKMSVVQAQQLIPCFMPMKLLSEVTHEFVSVLQEKQMVVKVYWDGKHRHVFKAATDEQRQEKIPEEWSNLQLYCDAGILPATAAKLCDMEHLFPKCRYFRTEIMETLVKLNISQIFCREEADGDMARAVSGKPNSYILGQDSDFCFFPNAKYIPLETLDAQQGLVTGVVIRRDELARELLLGDENLLIELAILCGNDYINPLSASFDNFNAKQYTGNAAKVLDFLLERQAENARYRVSSKSEDTEECLLFIRSLYRLESLDEFALSESVSHVDQSYVEDDLDPGDFIIEQKNHEPSTTPVTTLRPSVPRSMPVHELKMNIRVDRSIKDSIIRCLEVFVNQAEQDAKNGGEVTTMITRQHIEVFRKLKGANSQESDNLSTSKSFWRPSWSDIAAAYLIEKMLALALEQSAPIAHTTLPSSLFDQYTFLRRMHEVRGGQENEVRPIESSRINQPETEEKGRKFSMGEKQTLPIDEHESRILESISRNRVTIIQGETGCGKSSRIPVMILNAPPPDPAVRQVKMFISQPRRIAAKGLTERVRAVEPKLGKCFALRLGHGVREYESRDTRAWFVTTGYLVRLLANHPERFSDMSHLIIDEIHDRGVDLDLLCLLCRRMLRANSHIRLILMSATLAAELYQSYFGVEEPPIVVGARRFPVDEVYLDDLGEMKMIPQKARTTALELARECERMKCKFPPSMNYMDKVCALCSHIVASIARGGRSILIFVPGMQSILDITERIDQLFVVGVHFTCIPVHSEIPFDDQLSIFDATEDDECRVIVGTNSCESSITLPALDDVIDLGLCRQIIYNENSHRQLLTPAWISRASATQRSGRTGRIREGTVYRLYTRNCYGEYMDSFEPGEMVRIPLDSVILMLKGILPNEESAKMALMECLEPPNEATIERSFLSLYESRFITYPSDDGQVTNLGQFVSALGIDLSLGSLIGLGIQFGVGPEAIHLAGCLSFPKTPWIMSNPLIHPPKEFNNMCLRTSVSRYHFSCNLYSEPLAMMNAVFDYREQKKKEKWCWRYGFALARLRRLSSTCDNLQRRVAEMLEIPTDSLDLEEPPRLMHPSKLAILRCIQVFVFSDTIIEWQPKKKKSTYAIEGNYVVGLEKRSDHLEERHLRQVLMPDRHPFELRTVNTVEQVGKFTPFVEHDAALEGLLDGLQDRLLSYAIECELSWVAIWTNNVAIVLVTEYLSASDMNAVEEAIGNKLELLDYCQGVPVGSGNAVRGIAERRCGRWFLHSLPGLPDSAYPAYRRYCTNALTSQTAKSMRRDFLEQLRFLPSVKGASIQLGKNNDVFSFTAVILNAEPFNQRDLRDLFASMNEVTPRTKEITHGQLLIFPTTQAGPWTDSQDKEKTDDSKFRPWPQALIPEGAAIIYSLAAAARRSRVIRLSDQQDEGKQDAEGAEDEHEVLLFPEIDGEWRRLSTDGGVYLPDLAVPASALPLDGKSTVQCVCANGLEMRGGAMKMDGLTTLPHGRTFSFLCRLAFGLQEKIDESSEFPGFGPLGASLPADQRPDLIRRCFKAQALHESSLELGEELVCDVPNVVQLLDIFDGLNGEELKPWDNIESNPFTNRNLRKSRSLARHVTPMAVLRHQESTLNRNTDDGTASAELSAAVLVGGNGSSTSTERRAEFPIEVQSMFETELAAGQTVHSLPSTNILSLVVKSYCSEQRQMKFSGRRPEWLLFQNPDGLFRAAFDPQGIPHLSVVDATTGKDRVLFKTRPLRRSDALDCIPPGLHGAYSQDIHETRSDLFFSSIDTAIRMECAFWLERQFKVEGRHWYQTTINEMLQMMERERA